MDRARTSMDVGRGPMATACACSESDGFARSRVATRAPSIRGTRRTPSTCASGSWTLMEDCGPGRREGQVRRERLHPEYPAPLETENEGQLPRPVRAGRAPLDVLHGEPVLLVGEARQSCRVRTLRVGHLPPLLYPVVAVPVAQNREKPRLRGSAGPLAGSMLPALSNVYCTRSSLSVASRFSDSADRRRCGTPATSSAAKPWPDGVSAVSSASKGRRKEAANGNLSSGSATSK